MKREFLPIQQKAKIREWSDILWCELLDLMNDRKHHFAQGSCFMRSFSLRVKDRHKRGRRNEEVREYSVLLNELLFCTYNATMIMIMNEFHYQMFSPLFSMLTFWLFKRSIISYHGWRLWISCFVQIPPSHWQRHQRNKSVKESKQTTAGAPSDRRAQKDNFSFHQTFTTWAPDFMASVLYGLTNI